MPSSKKTSRTKPLIDHKLINSLVVTESDATDIKSLDLDLTFYSRKTMKLRIDKHN